MPSSLTKSNERPFFQSLQNEIDRVFQDFRDMSPWDTGEFFGQAPGKIVPKLDVSESNNHVEISTELPGVKLDEIDISATDNVLTISGEKSAETKKEENDYHVTERHYGSFRRSIPLNFAIDPDKVTADYADGVLTIKVEKPEEIAARTQKIKISSAA